MKTYLVQVRLGGYRIVSKFQGQGDDTIQDDFIKQLEKKNFSVDLDDAVAPERLFFFFEEIKNEPTSEQRIVGQKDGVGKQLEPKISIDG